MDHLFAQRHRRRRGRLLREDLQDELAPVRPVAEPRQGQHETLEPVKEVLAERAAPDALLDPGVHRAHKADVDLGRRLGVERDHLALRQHVEQLGLYRQGQGADSSRNSVPPCASAILPR